MQNKNLVETKEEDFLTADQNIPGQNFVCLSFVSPEKIIKQKQVYKLLNFIKEKYKIDKTYEEMDEDYKCFLVNNNDKLERKYFEDNDYHTSVRGLKVRGVYDTQREAANRAKFLRKLDPNHNVFVGQVGFWLPWDPDPFDVQEQEYLETELNTLMKSKKENELKKDMHFQEEKAKRVQDAIKYGKKIPEGKFEDELYKDDPWTKKQKEQSKEKENSKDNSDESKENENSKDNSNESNNESKSSNDLSKEDEDELNKAIKELESN